MLRFDPPAPGVALATPVVPGVALATPERLPRFVGEVQHDAAAAAELAVVDLLDSNIRPQRREYVTKQGGKS